MARVAHLFRAVKHRLPMLELPEVRAIQNRGFEGCAHGRPDSSRQVLLVDLESLETMGLAPGTIRENITTEGLNVNGLRIGEQLCIGTVRLEVTAICTPCDQLEKIRPGLRREIRGRRGMLCRVLAGGTLRQGDAIVRVAVTSGAGTAA